MEQQITYDLCKESRDSNQYYLDICVFTEKLMFATYWKLYIQRAVTLSQINYSKLIKTIDKYRAAETDADYYRALKGKLTASYLFECSEEYDYSADAANMLVRWMQATGEYTYTYLRVERVVGYLKKLKDEDCEKLIRRLVDFATSFQHLGDIVLGKYVSGVESFVNQLQRDEREDAILVSRSTLEYYLNMVGAQVLNESYKNEFETKKEILVLLPGCMMYRIPEKCKAVETIWGHVCRGCSSECPVKQIMEQLLEGGFRARSLGFAPQCVPLDRSGCNHWNSTRQVTDINRERLNKILGTGGNHEI